ncbi:MAG: hypothetical protein BGP20_06640 [Thiobacillus sp. 63-78]|mgnify:CR=1 FL=1|uniref:Eco57I restriction-modification methylase domain-containing protein n=1 Tax=Thiobacillus sp. 63-78 TaxID=1895859 RepID=UPI0009684448|nr:DNA methyltransferase [Thiobacillus sp. 63-78]OJZ15594.1 MAG: hypothetical protein BGP20_06640 [Thiobacillus sp. 63-78]
MAKLDFAGFQKHLSTFDFPRLFVEVLGWNYGPVAERDWQEDATNQLSFSRRMVAELGGVAVLQVVPATGWPDEATCAHIWKQLSQRHVENILIFTDQRDNATQSLWYWVKRGKDEITGKPKNTPRRHEYFRGQPVDLFASKLQAMVVELSELDAAGRMPVLEAARRIQSALDVEKTTKRFFNAYQEQHQELLAEIEGIDDERDRRWYASVILNRLMFVWFMQKKGFLDHADYDYLSRQFAASQARGAERFFSEFLSALFFEAFAKPATERTAAVRTLTGDIPYLNGGLFLHHPLELDANKQPRLGITLRISDRAFEGVFKLFAAFSWNLDDTPGGDADEINPDVLGYIFEKYINQKAFGAYYTRPEITNYLAERSIHKRVLEAIHEPAVPELGLKEVSFASVPDLLAKMDNVTALKLVNSVLPSINILDPAVGSGAFLVAALKVLVNIYSAVVGRAELGASDALQSWLKTIQKEHPSVAYYIKRRIVTDNLYGVDIMQEATEIAKLRLFLTMVASVRKVEELEPLPNIDFNILPGNSLVGLMRVDAHEFDCKQDDLFKTPFRKLLEEKNRKLETYRHTADMMGRDIDLRVLRDDIDQGMTEATNTLNELLRDQFEALGVKYEQATWDAARSTLGKPKKLKITREHIDAQTPFHWGYMFDGIMQKQGGFDIILTNPPWEIFKPQAKEFFADHSELVSKNKMTIKEFEKEQGKLLKDKAVREAWLAYESRFPHMSAWFRAAPEYRAQSAVVNGKKTGSDLNLYKLFLERCYALLRPGGHCGIVIPSGIYTDLGAKGLRDLLFNHSRIEGLFCFENRKTIFESVDSRFKFVVLTFEKADVPRLQATAEQNASAAPDDLLTPFGGTVSFPAAFMRHNVAELERFPAEGALWLDVALIRKLSPDSHSVMEFKSEQDIAIAEKLLKHPLLGDKREGEWQVGFTAEFHMTNDAKGLFETEPAQGRLPLYEGKMIWQFDAHYEQPRYWVDSAKGRQALLGRREDHGQWMDYQAYRLGFRDIAANTNERTLVSTLIPPTFHGNKLPTAKVFDENGNRLLDSHTQLFLCTVWNSFVIDWMLRQKVTTTINFFYLHQLPVPRLTEADSAFVSIVERAARLTCTTPEFDDLAKEVGLGSHKNGATDPAERARLRAELDGLVAHLYGLTEAEFAHILTTFPLVAEPVKQAARNAWRDVERGLIT